MRIEQERIVAGGTKYRVITDQWPMSCGDRAVLLIHPETHIDAARNALAVADHQRRAIVSLRLAEGLQSLLRVGTHGDLRDVDVSVSDRLQREILLRHRLAGGGG